MGGDKKRRRKVYESHYRRVFKNSLAKAIMGPSINYVSLNETGAASIFLYPLTKG